MARVTLNHLRKVFSDKTVAVHDLNLEVEDEEFLTLLGPSGCGKTTTLRMIAGLENPTSGSIQFGDLTVTEMPPARRNIAMVFQSYALYPHLTVRGNLEYPLKRRGVAKSKWPALVQRAAELLQIESLLDRKPRQLSGGQQQRVALGRAIIRDPQVFLLDEPLSNLDAKLRAHMRAELIQLRRRIGRTMIYVTHDQLEAMTMSDRIAVMDGGWLKQLGTPDEIYHRPADRFVAGFMGTPAMNFIDGELQGEQPRVLSPAMRSDLPIEVPSGLKSQSPGRRVVVGIRPEDILLGTGSLNAEILVVEPTGHEALVMLKIGDQTLTARVGSEMSLRPMTHIPVEFRASRLHFFDSESGARLGDL